ELLESAEHDRLLNFDCGTLVCADLPVKLVPDRALTSLRYFDFLCELRGSSLRSPRLKSFGATLLPAPSAIEPPAVPQKIPQRSPGSPVPSSNRKSPSAAPPRLRHHA